MPASKPVLACLALLATCVSASAQEDELESLLRREVEGPSRYAQSLLDAPAPVAVFGQREAALLGHQTVAEMLGRLPGVHLSQTRQYIAVGLRGLNRPGDYNARLLVTIDGYRVNDALYDQALPELEFPMAAEWVKRLELVYGPSASVYGANALLGVVNLVSVDGADMPGVRVKTSLGSFGTQRAMLQFGRNTPEGGDLFVGAQLQRSDGENLELPELGLPAPVRGLDGVRQASLFAKYRLGAWRAALTAVQRDKDVATAPYGTVPGEPGTRFRDRYHHAEIGYEEDWRSPLRRTVRLGVAGSAFRGDYLYDGSLLNRDVSRSLSYTLDARMQWRGWLNHELQLGLDARWVPNAIQQNYDLEPAASYLDSRGSTRRVGLFLQDQWRLSAQWQLTGGLRVDRISGYAAEWSPRMALVWRPRAHEALKLMAGNAFRAPNLAEQFYGDGLTWVPSNGLQPERLRSAELSWERALDSRTTLTVGAYRTRLRRVIELQTDEATGLERYANVGSIATRGLDIGLERQFEQGRQWRADVSLIEARGDEGWLSNSPRWLVKGHWIEPLATRLSLGLELQAQGRRSGRVEVGSQWTANLALRYAGEGHVLALRALNLTDRRLFDPAGPENEALLRVPQPRRSLRLDWQWQL